MEDKLIGAIEDAAKTLHKSERHRFLRPRVGSRRIRNRLVQKYGLCNISLVNVPKQHRKYFSDIFNTILEIKWRWCFLFFTMSFFTSWTLFAIIYYCVASYHGDLVHNKGTWKPCIENGNSAFNIFLFSITTQTTIGYGHRYPTDQCPLIVIIMTFQFMTGVMFQTLMTGVIFAKLARPIKRAATIIFSKNAVICMRDTKLCLLFRVGDMRKSSLAEAHVRLQMIQKCITHEGEVLPFHQFDMNVGYDSGLDRVFVMWPITICHEIDETSPLYEVSKESLKTAKFEIIAILEGVVESVGSTTQARTSYLPNEVLWGKRFERLVTYQKENGDYQIDFGKFHNVQDVDTPTCSAKELEEQFNSECDEENNGLVPCITVDNVENDDFYSQSSKNRVTQRSVDDNSHHVYQIDSDEYNSSIDSDLDLGLRINGNIGIINKPKLSVRSARNSLRFPSNQDLRRKNSLSLRRGPDLF